jgi:fused signal recognition particle receptor
LGTLFNLGRGIRGLSFSGRVDDEYFDELEERLILADAGVKTSGEMIQKLRERARKERVVMASELKELLISIAEQLLSTAKFQPGGGHPRVILVVGVNGTGKTTTIGKLSARFAGEGKSVVLAAADTFRAAAIEQLGIWAGRTGAEMIAHSPGADPAAVVCDAVRAAVARGADVVICDTAGRLHNKQNLMDELSKIRRVIERELPGGSPEVLLVLDAATGQNALAQAKNFRDAVGAGAIVLTKLDGTAKGGIVLAIAGEIDLPVAYVGTGEGIDDLHPFSPADFARALFEGEANAD